ncbi:MAG: MarR family transcriptional regulator [Gammaproteobacteria bacterium]|nr:MarR family transcriptional regulator [Gammaproteobacteria bacterium]
MSTEKDYLLRGLLRAYYWYDESLQNHFFSCGIPTVPRSESMIMLNVANGVTRPAHLARNLGISRQAIQQTLRSMEGEGLITLVADPSDGRSKVVRFSDEGKRRGIEAMRGMRRIDRELEKRLGKTAFNTLKRSLTEVDWGPVVQPSPRVDKASGASRAKRSSSSTRQRPVNQRRRSR